MIKIKVFLSTAKTQPEITRKKLLIKLLHFLIRNTGVVEKSDKCYFFRHTFLPGVNMKFKSCSLLLIKIKFFLNGFYVVKIKINARDKTQKMTFIKNNDFNYVLIEWQSVAKKRIY